MSRPSPGTRDIIALEELKDLRLFPMEIVLGTSLETKKEDVNLHGGGSEVQNRILCR